MDPYISIVTLGVRDIDRATAFYERLGFSLHDASVESHIAFFELPGTWLALFPRESLAEDAHVPVDGRGFSGVTLAHNVTSRAAVDAVIEEAVDAGAELVKSAREADWGGYSGYFADPEGHLWEVAWNPDFDVTMNQ